MMSLGQRIRQKRESLKLTQEDLAKSSGITPQYISVIEQDKRSPSLAAVVKLAEELGVTLDYLVFGQEMKSLDLVAAIKSDKSLDLEAKRTLITLVRRLRVV